MLGRSTASLEVAPRSWIQRIWGCGDIHARQKWTAVWPHLARLPRSGLRILDAGCGSGAWAIELAARRPGWRIVGVDMKDEELDTADRARRQLGLANVSFVRAEFLDYRPEERFDLVLSVCSAHYLVQDGHGLELFASIRAWLNARGLLMLLGPRRPEHGTTIGGGQAREWRVFSADELAALCQSSGLTIRVLSGRLGPVARYVKQLDWACSGRWRALNACFYPIQCGLTFVDARIDYGTRSSLMWLLIARA